MQENLAHFIFADINIDRISDKAKISPKCFGKSNLKVAIKNIIIDKIRTRVRF